LNEILQIVSVNIFEQTSLAELLATQSEVLNRETGGSPSQNLLVLKPVFYSWKGVRRKSLRKPQ
jgi:hypothetical protein